MPHADRLALAFATRAVRLPDAGDVLVLNAQPSGLLDLVPPGRLRCEQPVRPVHDALAGRGVAVAPRAAGPAALVVVNLGRSRAENLGAIARALALLPPGGLLVVNGAKTEGVDSLARQVAAVLPVDGAFVKAHGRVFWLARPDELPVAVAGWAAAAAPARTRDGFLTMPGLFSPEGPDAGSRRLAEAFDAGLRGRVADLGAGWGWLAQAALARCPGIERLDLYEADARALELARENVTDPRAAFHWADATTLGPGVPPCDSVIANPPFHAGRAAEPDLGRAFIAAAARILKPAGRLLMVANRQLPYEATLEAAFGRWHRLSEDRGYKVFSAERPRRA